MTLETLTLMDKYSDGIINITTEKERFKELNIYALYEQTISSYKAAKVLSVETSMDGSKVEKMHKTIQAILDPKSTPQMFRQPGVIFPIQYRKGGVLKRAGRPEASVDLTKFAGLYPAGVTSLIVKDSGEPYLLKELKELVNKLNIKWTSVSSLIQYRKQRESLIKRAAKQSFPTHHGILKSLVVKMPLMANTMLL